MHDLVGSAMFGLVPVPMMPSGHCRTREDAAAYRMMPALQGDPASLAEGEAPSATATRRLAQRLAAGQLHGLLLVNWRTRIQQWSQGLSHRE
jgi:hypothetical protein